MQLRETYDSAEGFGVDAENLAPGSPIIVDAKTFGYPRRSLADLDAGDYYVQAVFNVYEQFHLASGKTVWLPPDKGEGQHWNRQARQSLQQAAEDPLRSKIEDAHHCSPSTRSSRPSKEHRRIRWSSRNNNPLQSGSSSNASAAKNSAPSGAAISISAHGSFFPTDSKSTPTQNIPSSSIRITSIPASVPHSSQPRRPIPNRPTSAASKMAIASFRTGPTAACRA